MFFLIILLMIFCYYFTFTYVAVLSTCMSVDHVYVSCLWKLEGAVSSPETGVTDICKFPCRSWELNLGPSKEESVLLTTGPSLQLLLLLFGFYIYLLIGVQDRKVMSTSHWAVEKGCRICWLYFILEKKIYLELV